MIVGVECETFALVIIFTYINSPNVKSRLYIFAPNQGFGGFIILFIVGLCSGTNLRDQDPRGALFFFGGVITFVWVICGAQCAECKDLSLGLQVCRRSTRRTSFLKDSKEEIVEASKSQIFFAKEKSVNCNQFSLMVVYLCPLSLNASAPLQTPPSLWECPMVHLW